MSSRKISQVLAFALLLGLLVRPCAAAGVRSALDDIVRGAARLSDDVPLSSMDELAQRLANSTAMKKAVDSELTEAGLITKQLGDAPSATARSVAIAALLRQLSGQLDAATIATLKASDEGIQEYAVVLAKGAERVSDSVPDLLQRSRFVSDGGIETVTAIGLHGPDAAKAALRLDAALKSGNLVIPNGLRQITLKDFGKVMSDTSGASWKFWTTYVVPHWKLWAGSGLVAAYLVDPEGFQDKAGELSEKGMKAVVSFVGEVSAAMILGVGQGSAEAGEKVVQAAKDTYFTGWSAIYSIPGTILVLFLAGFAFRRTRHFIFYPLRWLNQAPPQK